MKGKVESSYKPSFFDDEETQASSGFIKPTLAQQNMFNAPILQTESVVMKGLNFQQIKQGTFSVAGPLLGFHKDESSSVPTEVINILYARLRQCKTHQGYGFALMKNGSIFELCFGDQATADVWEQALKNVCVMTNFHEEYHGLDVLGEGSFARVYLVRSKSSKKKFAAKVFLKEELNAASKKTPKASLFNEISMMRLLDHENIIKLHEVHETQRSVYLIIEYVENTQTFQSVLKKANFRISHSETEVKQMIYSILDALAYMASKGIMHRDLKPGNILIEKGGKIKIIDFGLATFVSEKKLLYERCGTPGYIAPEVFRYSNSDPSTRYNTACDAFSAGCILFFILFGYPMFDGPNSSKIFRLNKNFTDPSAIHVIQRELFDSTSRINKAGLSLLLLLIEYSPTRRMTAENALKNVYFNKFVPQSATKQIELTTANSEKTLANPVSPVDKATPISPLDKYKLEPGSLASVKLGKNQCMATLNSGSNAAFEPVKTRANDKYSLHENLSTNELSARGRSGSTEKSKYSINKIESVTQLPNPSSFAPNGNNRATSTQRIDDNKKPYSGLAVQGNQNLLKASLFAQKNKDVGDEDSRNPLRFMKSHNVECEEYLPHETGNSNKMEIYHHVEGDSSDDITDIGDENVQIEIVGTSFAGIKPQRHPVNRGA